MNIKITRLSAVVIICLSLLIISKSSFAKNNNGKLAVIYSLKPLVVNLSGENGRNYLKITIALEMGTKQLAGEVDFVLPKIIDSTLILLNSKTFEELHAYNGKTKLRKEITAKINRILDKGHIKNIYFTEFILM